jgi:hypothetical protein
VIPSSCAISGYFALRRRQFSDGAFGESNFSDFGSDPHLLNFLLRRLPKISPTMLAILLIQQICPTCGSLENSAPRDGFESRGIVREESGKVPRRVKRPTRLGNFEECGI